jgi:DNA-binding transcriptional MerR regulator
VPDTLHYSIQELADLADVSRRTVRYYVQEGLLPAPLGVGRGRHYGREHLDRLLEVKSLQADGRSLDDVRAIVASRGRSGQSRVASPSRAPGAIERSLWRRLEFAPGVELHVVGHVSLPGPLRLQELADWCRTYFATRPSDEEDNER